jgi:hypothetical protein
MRIDSRFCVKLCVLSGNSFTLPQGTQSLSKNGDFKENLASFTGKAYFCRKQEYIKIKIDRNEQIDLLNAHDGMAHIVQ